MNLANKLTLLRVILIPFFIVCFYIPNLVVNTISVNNYLIPYANLLGLVIFLLAAITDFIDGYIARKYNMITDFGKFMDPLADKLLVELSQPANINITGTTNNKTIANITGLNDCTFTIIFPHNL